MGTRKKPGWEMQIYVPGAAASQPPEDDAVEKHSLRSFLGGSVQPVDGETLQKQWKKATDNLLKLTSSVASSVNEWSVDSIEIGLTLSAKGELLFIAEAGAEASVKMVLKRKP